MRSRRSRRAQRELGLPASIETRFQGAAEAFRASLDSTLLLVLAAVVTMYIVLGVLYESYIHPITILSTLPSAAVGALLALLITGQDLDLIAVIGIMLLIGIVKKNAIMMIDFALEPSATQGMAPREAIHQAALLRFRPILMTTLAALFGALPLMLATGSGAELRQPLGLVMVGGLLVSQVLTLFTTPVIYLFFDRLGRGAGAREQPSAAARRRARREGRHEPVRRRSSAGRSRRCCSACRSCWPARWRSAAAGRAAAAGGLPDDLGARHRCPAPARKRWRRTSPRRSSARWARIAGVTEIRSSSSQGSTRIMLEFELGRDIDARGARSAGGDQRRARSQLPSALPGMPQYRKVNPSQAPIMALALSSETHDARASSTTWRRRCSRRRSRRSGVGEVTVGGSSLPAVRVELDRSALDPVRHRARRRAARDRARQPAPPEGRRSRTASAQWQIQASDQLRSADEYRRSIIALPQRRAGPAGRRGQGQRRRRGPLQQRFLQRPAGGAADRQPPAAAPTSSRPSTRIKAQLPALRAFLPAA